MKNAYIILLLLFIFSMTTCDLDPKELPIHYDILKFSKQQVWWRNEEANKLSEQRKGKFTGNCNVDVYVMGNNGGIAKESSGKIKKGLLNFSIGTPNNLLESNDLLYVIFKSMEGRGWSKVEIDNPKIKGNLITLITNAQTDDKTFGLIAFNVTGTDDSLKGAYMHYVYVDDDCVISDDAETFDEVNYTYESLDLSLKKGWNALYMTEKYTTTGASSFSVKIEHPDIKWLLWPMPNPDAE